MGRQGDKGTRGQGDREAGMVTRHDVRKYIRYIFDSKSFRPDFDASAISDQALQTAKVIRGCERDPAIIIHGIMPRSGTVYVGELLRLHPDLYAYPNHIWELPFLQHTGDILDLQEKFLLAYEQNAGKIGDQDFLPLFGASLMAYLHGFVPSGKRLLLKIPSVQHLDHFHSVFPYEYIMVLVRDGRDVVHSTLKTWPQLRFSMVCLRWRRAANMVLAFDEQYGHQTEGYWLARFEDTVRDPAAFVRTACQRFGLDEGRYPFERLDTIPVHGSSTLRERGGAVWKVVAKTKGFQPIGHWQQWSAMRKRIFKMIAGQPLMALGYCEDLNW